MFFIDLSVSVQPFDAFFQIKIRAALPFDNLPYNAAGLSGT
jgi:hypothetical protein